MSSTTSTTVPKQILSESSSNMIPAKNEPLISVETSHSQHLSPNAKVSHRTVDNAQPTLENDSQRLLKQILEEVMNIKAMLSQETKNRQKSEARIQNNFDLVNKSILRNSKSSMQTLRSQFKLPIEEHDQVDAFDTFLSDNREYRRSLKKQLSQLGGRYTTKFRKAMRFIIRDVVLRDFTGRMGLCTQITLLAVAVAAGLIYMKFQSISSPLPPPKFDDNAYWGPGKEAEYKEDKSVQPFKIDYPADQINELSELIKKAVLPSPLEDVGFDYGINSKRFSKFLNYWRDDYLPRWKSEREPFLNSLPQYTTQIQGLKIHFIHVKPSKTANKKVVPLLLLHGWPGSVREFYDFVELLKTQRSDTNVEFDVVVPSLPGYGFSQGSSKTGFGVLEMSVVLRNLMIRLGYQRFYIQGGDWGSALGSTIATLFPQNIIGYHSNMCVALNTGTGILKTIIASNFPSYFVEKEYEDFHFPFGEKFSNLILESGYMHIQATKPDTIGTALLNNPVGLAAYILEKFATWTFPEYRSSPDGGLDNRKDLFDAYFDNIMIYYLSKSITTSVRLYSEAFSPKQLGHKLERVPTSVPTGCARFKNDLAHDIDWVLKEKYTNIVQSNYYKTGGHFAALEVPKVLHQDFMEFVKKVEK
ncbi:Juvenile hormone epoxide hydrolase 2 [Pseudolycoriella hygida]|uniref:Juvenile hormone epoxide hydrolase 2 n=1 Tax=Pseudolycoriella hygida TaxID=35572 RepID=A0A9Q0S4U9_9DIPT|nr:Juvenile hormone epoxide hydrolase 2 [Pseudolycoriella hygida]